MCMGTIGLVKVLRIGRGLLVEDSTENRCRVV